MTVNSIVGSNSMCKTFAMFFIACSAYSTSAVATNVYKCGNAYSELPCPGSELVEAKDARTPEQARHAQVATEKNWIQAQSLEKKRLAEEALSEKPEQTSGNAKAKAKSGSKDKLKGTKAKAKTNKKNAPEFFTASAEKPPKRPKP
ncbi:hypothetical protein [Rhodoferax aquaticus]|uniref:DUF4124 domain-containing protein n=1 Tax=Rhodoferax aquaticus TaxID=2527691 RepID=A0A515ELL1_9BURK|nr:hypothetical protein [Rhodoferax aquaticus]QDL53553.1 hypothetical protein EXZ61_04815 [Rhodoferax aquaticus]